MLDGLDAWYFNAAMQVEFPVSDDWQNIQFVETDENIFFEGRPVFMTMLLLVD